MERTVILRLLLTLVLLTFSSVASSEMHGAKGEGKGGLSALVVKIHVKGEYREKFLKEMLADAIGSEKKEPGCLMFNITHDNGDPNVLYLFEVYRNDQAVEAHKKTPHFLKWLESTKEWLAAPLEITPCTTIYPPAAAWKKRPAAKM